MSTQNPNQAVLNTIIGQFLNQAQTASTTNLAQMAKLQEDRAARLSATEARLKETLDDNHPKIVALREAATFAKGIQQNLQTTAIRASRRPKIKPNEWLVFGTVLNTQRQPLTGVRVRVFDKDCKFDDLLGDTETDEYGDFALIYHKCDFAELGEGELPELYLKVSDQQGKQLYSSENNIRYNAGRAEYFEITIND